MAMWEIYLKRDENFELSSEEGKGFSRVFWILPLWGTSVERKRE